MAAISKLRGLDQRVGAPEPSGHAIERQLRERDRHTNDFLQDLAAMQEERKYRFAGDTIEGIYTTVEHTGRVSAGQRTAINNIRRGVGDEEI